MTKPQTLAVLEKNYNLARRIAGLASGILARPCDAIITDGPTCTDLSGKPGDPVKIYINPGQVSGYSDDELRGIILHEIGHNLFSVGARPQSAILPDQAVELLSELQTDLENARYLNRRFGPRPASWIAEARSKDFRNYIADFPGGSGIWGAFALQNLAITPFNLGSRYLEKGNYCYQVQSVNYPYNISDPIADYNVIAADYYQAGRLFNTALFGKEIPFLEEEEDDYSSFRLFRSKDVEGLNAANLPKVVKRLEKEWPEIKRLLRITDSDLENPLPGLSPRFTGGSEEEEEREGKNSEEEEEREGKKKKRPGNQAGRKVALNSKMGIGTPSPTDRIIGENLGDRFKNILKIRKLTRFNGGYRSGRLDLQAARKVLTDPTESRLFRKRKTSGKRLNYSVGIALDTSGSMGSKIEKAGRAAYIAATACERAEIPTDLFTFDSSAYRKLKPEEFINLETDGGTYIKTAVETLVIKKPEETRRLNLIITDGLDNSITARTVEKLDQETGNLTLGIGLGLDTQEKGRFAEVFRPGRGVLVDQPEELAPVLTNILKRLVF